MYTNSMNIKLAFALMFILIVLPMFSAQTYLTNAHNGQPATIGQIYTIKQSCSNATAGYVSSLSSPNTIYITTPQVMTRIGDNFYYNFTPLDYGEYLVYGNCNGVPWEYSFMTTATGQSQVFIISILAMFIILGFVSFILRLYNQEEYYLTIFAGALFVFAGVFALNSLQGMLQDFEVNIIAIALIGFGLINLGESIWRYFPDN